MEKNSNCFRIWTLGKRAHHTTPHSHIRTNSLPFLFHCGGVWLSSVPLLLRLWRVKIYSITAWESTKQYADVLCKQHTEWNKKLFYNISTHRAETLPALSISLSVPLSTIPRIRVWATWPSIGISWSLSPSPYSQSLAGAVAKYEHNFVFQQPKSNKKKRKKEE